MRAKLTRAAFRRWLESKEPEKSVGFGHHAYSCPIACYFLQSENLRSGQVSVLDNEYLVSATGDYKPLPRWAQQFIATVDLDFEGRNVTAQDALEILNRG